MALFSPPLLVLERVLHELADGDWKQARSVSKCWRAVSSASLGCRLLRRTVPLLANNFSLGRAALRSVACVSAAFNSAVGSLLAELAVCPRCRSHNTGLVVRQIRCGDEPTEFRAHCLSCTHAWFMK